MTARQKSALRDLLASHDGATLHHGDAIGADAEAHDIAIALACTIVIHPPLIEGDGEDRIRELVAGVFDIVRIVPTRPHQPGHGCGA